jgi:glucose-1-phosphate adenylyltransferase
MMLKPGPISLFCEKELRMPSAKILALIMAGGAGTRMDLLTERRAKPALPYAGVYRLIDFPLSNCAHSRITDVWVIEQFQAHTMNDHLANGRPWDLDRTYGGLRIIQPHTGTPEGGWHHGNADAIYRNRRFIREFEPDLLLVLSADHIYKLDYRKVIDAHTGGEAEVTLVTTRVPIEQAGRFGVVRVDSGGKMVDFAYKPDKPDSDIVTTEVFVYNARTLLDTIDELAEQASTGEDSDASLKDFGHELLPRLVERGRAYAYPLDGYWRDVGTIASYWESHMDLLAPDPPIDLDEPGWPILTFGVQRLPARIEEPARIARSLVSPGCVVHGQVIRSVLSPGVVVEQGAVVRDSVLLPGCVVEAGAWLVRAIVDGGAHIGAGARVGATGGAAADEEVEKTITLVGQNAKIPPGAHIPAGGRVEPDADDERAVGGHDGRIKGQR